MKERREIHNFPSFSPKKDPLTIRFASPLPVPVPGRSPSSRCAKGEGCQVGRGYPVPRAVDVVFFRSQQNPLGPLVGETPKGIEKRSWAMKWWESPKKARCVLGL